jgi:hypothetical protein
MKTLVAGSKGMASVVPARGGRVRGWQHWAPYAAVGWSLVYAALGVYWALGGRGFPFPSAAVPDPMGPLMGRFGPGVAWVVVLLAGLPAAAMGLAMLRGARGPALRPVFILAGGLLASVLLLLMIGLDLLVLFGYIPYTVRGLLSGAGVSQGYLKAWVQWATLHQGLCLIGGFLWLAATIVYARRSADACLYCGRRDGPEGWQSPTHAARWGRAAVYVSLVAPVLYAVTRYAWALGYPLGMSEAYLRDGQARGIWTSGLFLATFGLVGAGLTLGLVQRWGEVFPRSLRVIGLAGRRVPSALAVVPAALAAVLLIVGGIGIWSGLGQMVANVAATGADEREISGAVIFQLGPTLLFPVWGAALAVATLGYAYRRRGACRACGRGATSESREPASGYRR